MDKLKTVKVVAFVNGIERACATQDVPDWAVDSVVAAVCAQVEDPDLDVGERGEVTIPVTEGTIVGVAPQGRYTS